MLSHHTGPRSYAYLWHYGPRCGVAPVPHSVPPVQGGNWAAHSAEVRFVFGGSSDPYGKKAENCPFTEQEQTLSNQTMNLWGSFARDGTPAADGVPSWPTAQKEGRVMEMRLEGLTVSEPGFRSEQCAFWRRETAPDPLTPAHQLEAPRTAQRPNNPTPVTVYGLRPYNLSADLSDKDTADAAGDVFFYLGGTKALSLNLPPAPREGASVAVFGLPLAAALLCRRFHQRCAICEGHPWLSSVS